MDTLGIDASPEEVDLMIREVKSLLFVLTFLQLQVDRSRWQRNN